MSKITNLININSESKIKVTDRILYRNTFTPNACNKCRHDSQTRAYSHNFSYYLLYFACIYGKLLAASLKQIYAKFISVIVTFLVTVFKMKRLKS